MFNIKKIFDLSQPVYDKCPGWGTYELTDVKYEAFYPNDGFTAERIDMNSHTGTHLDAPFHFNPEGKTIDEIPVESFQGDAVIVDLCDELREREPITVKHLEKYDAEIHENSIVIIHTGWCKKRGYSETYYHDWPYLSLEGAVWLKEKKVKGVGIDTMSVGGWYDGTGRPSHETLLPAGIWILEEINFPDELLKYKTCYLSAYPIKLKGFSGAPARAVAMILDEHSLK
jgi:arylformamidase